MDDVSGLNGKYLGIGLAGAGLFLGLGITIAAYFGASTAARVLDRKGSVTVKGLAEKDVVADVASWRIPFRAFGKSHEEAMAKASAAQQKVVAFARRWKLTDEEIVPEPLSIEVRESTKKLTIEQFETKISYHVSGAVRFRSEDVFKIRDLTTKTEELLKSGVFLGRERKKNIGSSYGTGARYGFVGLNRIKPEMIAEATKNARLAATRFADDTGQKIGALLSARQGAVQIQARDGLYPEASELYKKVRIVTTVTYKLN